MGMPQQHIIIEAARDNWSWLKYFLGIVATIVTSVVSTIIVKKLTKKKKN